MTVYPFSLDNDTTLIRVDDNLSELGTEAINQARSSIFAIEEAVGLQPQGSKNSLAERLNISINADGTLKSSALTSVGLATLPIVDNQVANNAGIKEFKLSLDFSTSSLNSGLTANSAAIAALNNFYLTINSNLLAHIAGTATLLDGSNARHFANQIDLGFVLLDKDGVPRSATQVASALQQINTAFTSHENAVANAHVASAIVVDTSNFVEIPDIANNVQLALQALDDADRITVGTHQQDMHSNGIPRTARAVYADGYGSPILGWTTVSAYLVNPPANTPVDNNATGDDLVVFVPNNDGYVFDAKFAQVRVGDRLSINYGNGVEGVYRVESTRFTPGLEWIVRIDGVNLCNSVDGYASARIDRMLFEDVEQHVLAIAPANNNIDSNIPGSLIVANPRGAAAFGFDFDASMLDSTHYNLYLQLYPTGNPTDKVINLPQIDVTGNAGSTPGDYTIQSIVNSTNAAFRAGGFNYRFIAFERGGNFGIALADEVGASFSIINGSLSGSSLVVGSYSNNVVGDASDGKDALGLGVSKARLASPAFTATYSAALPAANFPTKVMYGRRNRNYVVNGVKRDSFKDTYKANVDGYWDATILNRIVVGPTTVKTVYRVLMNLDAAELFPGKTITVQPAVAYDDALYSDVDYGRFVIESCNFTGDCFSVDGYTDITVVNGIHAVGAPVASSGTAGLPVKLFFGEDSVGFNALQISDTVSGGISYLRYHELFITDEGKTFSHERARMPEQAETADLLSISNRWKIDAVSAKLSGYDDVTTSQFRRFVRFYVLNFDSATGEYDGYIGRPTFGGPGVSQIGPTVRVKKGWTGRYYDFTNLDYIDLRFEENSVFPGSAIASSAAPRYVDIELFPGLALDQEVMCLGSFQVNTNRVDNVRDCRTFGNVSEKDFTDSAIAFIESGERLLHSNGIIQGLDYLGFGANAGELSFGGGIALVDGRFVPVNPQTVRLPEIVDNSAVSLPAFVEWMVCVNKSGIIVPVLRDTSSESQRFMKKFGSVSNYYVDSLTMTDLIDKRKDLQLLYVVSATIASTTITRVLDVRKYVKEESFGDDYTLSNQAGKLGSIRTWEAFKNIANRYVGTKSFKLIGDYVLNAAQANFGGVFTVAVNSGMTIRGSGPRGDSVFEIDGIAVTINGAPVTFRNIDLVIKNGGSLTGNFIFEDCSVYVENCNTAIIPSTNAFTTTTPGSYFTNFVARNTSFTWVPLTTQLVTSRDPTVSGSMILATDMSVIKITGCEFNCAVGHAPFIRCNYVTPNFVSKSIKILNNVFNDTAATDVYNVCFAVTKVQSIETLFNEIEISGNNCNSLQTIVLAQAIAGNVFVTNNRLGYLAYDLFLNTNAESAIVSNNKMVSAYRSGIDGELLSSTYSMSSFLSRTSGIIFDSNFVSNIVDIITYTGPFSRPPRAELTIVNNRMLSSSKSIYNGKFSAIDVKTLDSNCIVSGNIIKKSADGYYNYGIITSGNSKVFGNTVDTFTEDGIFSTGNVVQINDNSIYRRTETVNSLIKADPLGTNPSFSAVGNFFQDGYTDAAMTNIATIDSGFSIENEIIEDNKNHIKFINISSPAGDVIYRASPVTGTDLTEIIYNHVKKFPDTVSSAIKETGFKGKAGEAVPNHVFGMTTITLSPVTATDIGQVGYIIPLRRLLNKGNFIRKIEVTVQTTVAGTISSLHAMLAYYTGEPTPFISNEYEYDLKSSAFLESTPYTLTVFPNRAVSDDDVIILAVGTTTPSVAMSTPFVFYALSVTYSE